MQVQRATPSANVVLLVFLDWYLVSTTLFADDIAERVRCVTSIDPPRIFPLGSHDRANVTKFWKAVNQRQQYHESG